MHATIVLFLTRSHLDWRNESTDSWRHESTGSDAGDDLHNEWARAEVEAESKWQENVDMVRDVKNHKALFGEPSIAVKCAPYSRDLYFTRRTVVSSHSYVL